MKFSPGQEVTPNTQNFKLFGITEESPMIPEFGKVYTVQGYNPDIICGHGRPVFYLKEFPPTYIFCETSFDPLPKLKLCDLPSGISTSNSKPMKKRKHIADSMLTLKPKEEKAKRFYPKRVFKKHIANECPRCEGSGIVMDMKTRLERPCTCCGGKGHLGEKPV